MKDCLFCKIIEGEVNSYKIYEDEDYLAFLDISQISDGHTLLIPKIHVKYVWDIEDSQGFFEAAKKIARNMQKVTGKSSVVSATIGEMVAHAHLHLVPDSVGSRDMFFQGWNKARSERKLGEQEMNEIRERFMLSD